MKKILITKRLTALLWALVLTLMPMSLMADNTPLSVTVTFEVGSFVYEQAGNAFDGKPETKWCGGILTTNNTNAYVQVQLAEKSKLDYYYLYTGNDINYTDDDSQQQRNPKEWKLYAKVNEGDEWTLISHVTDAGLPTTVSTRSNNYKIDAAYQNIEYNYLKFEILQIEKGTIFEVGEICFINCNHTFGSDDICTECGYKKQQYDDFVTVASASQMYKVLSGNAHAKVRLMDDIYLSDKGNDGTFCSTFYGTLDGNGHTIYGSKDGTRQNRNYLFTYSEGATFKNLTFKHIRKNSEDHHNQAIITSQAKNGCVFENVTFENCGTWTNYDNAGSAAGYAVNCTFKDITVKNSDFTVDQDQSGCVVGHAIGCSFENIKVENCESTAAVQTSAAENGKAGGVVGRADNCTFNNIKILGSFIKTYDTDAGGVAGYSTKSHYTNCTIDDQSCVYVDGWGSEGDAGGIIGYAHGDEIKKCINSALIVSANDNVGGIVGYADEGSKIEYCLNTGMITSIELKNLTGDNGYYSKYKNKQLPCVTKYYNGKEYVVRKIDEIQNGFNCKYYGGIVGILDDSTLSKCANIGCMGSSNVTGGIVGTIAYKGNATISDCLSNIEFRSSDKVSGLIGTHGYGGEGKTATITNCVNVTKAKDVGGNSGGYIVVNNIFSYYEENITAASLASGEICNKLGSNWEQNLGTDTYPTPIGDKGVYHTRKVTNQYGTACFPFVVKSNDKISCYRLSRKEEDGQDIKLVFEYNEEIHPGLAFLFRAAEAEDANADNPVEICFNNAGEVFELNTYGFSSKYWEMWGTFEQKVFDETTDPSSKYIYYVSDGKIKNAKKTTIAPYRAWIQGENIDTLTGNGGQAKAIRFVLEDEDGETTALEFVGNDLKPVQNGKTYSIMGTEVDENYRGIVMKNGKKYMNK